MKITIIIPYYNTKRFTDELLDRLNLQITDDVEVILVDDGSKQPYKTDYSWCKVIRQENGGASSARNTGLDNATGDFIAFIDSDDLVVEDYIKQIQDKLEEGYDYLFLSWKTIGSGWQANIILKTIDDKFPPDNLCVWNRIYRRDMIGAVRFNTKKLVAEDAEFIRLVEVDGKKKGIISNPIYLYRSDTPESLSKRFAAGLLNTKRVVYYYKIVTSDMKNLIREFKKDDKEAEVILMTESNQIPELADYAMVIRPRRIKATDAKGEPCNLIEIIELPTKTQVVIWTSFAQSIGGIEAFTYYFSKAMCKYYDIIVLYDTMDDRQIDRVSKYVECRKNNPSKAIECDFLIVNRIIDDIPSNIHAKTTIQMVHGAKINYATVPQDRDIMVCVSDYVRQSWQEKAKDAHVIHNIMALDEQKKKPLLLVTASRLDAPDKGLRRMCKMAELMDKQGVPYIWLCFSNKANVSFAPKNMVWMEPTLDIMPWIQKADYLVQLSDEEAYCYSIVESLAVGTPVIVTPLDVLKEIGVIDGENGYIIPYDIQETYKTTKFLNIPEFEYKVDTKAIIKQWRSILGNTKPKHAYKPQELVVVACIHKYYDKELHRLVEVGERLRISNQRATMICEAGFGRRV